MVLELAIDESKGPGCIQRSWMNPKVVDMGPVLFRTCCFNSLVLPNSAW